MVYKYISFNTHQPFYVAYSGDACHGVTISWCLRDLSLGELKNTVIPQHIVHLRRMKVDILNTVFENTLRKLSFVINFKSCVSSRIENNKTSQMYTLIEKIDVWTRLNR